MKPYKQTERQKTCDCVERSVSALCKSVHLSIKKKKKALANELRQEIGGGSSGRMREREKERERDRERGKKGGREGRKEGRRERNSGK